MVGIPQPLRREEIPSDLSDLLDYIDFASQRISDRGDGKRLMKITVVCPSCGMGREIHVATIRQRLRHDDRHHKQWTGSCRKCSAKRNGRKMASCVGSRAPSWKGGKTITRGYVRRRLDTFEEPNAELLQAMLPSDGYILEHRAMVALALGRPLLEDEFVHHVNGDPSDNRLENLQLVDHHKRAICPRCGWRMDKWPKE